MSNVEYDVIIGLEVHTQLKTRSKIFCGCSSAFHPDHPNTQTCPVCLGLPGSLPVMNRSAFELSLKTALALNCEIARSTRWDRKQYYYPDLPKGYQISQYDLPFSSHGLVEIALTSKRADEGSVSPAHLEEDAGKNVHDEIRSRARKSRRPESSRNAAPGDRQRTGLALGRRSKRYLRSVIVAVHRGV